MYPRGVITYIAIRVEVVPPLTYACVCVRLEGFICAPIRFSNFWLSDPYFDMTDIAGTNQQLTFSLYINNFFVVKIFSFYISLFYEIVLLCIHL